MSNRAVVASATHASHVSLNHSPDPRRAIRDFGSKDADHARAARSRIRVARVHARSDLSSPGGSRDGPSFRVDSSRVLRRANLCRQLSRAGTSQEAAATFNPNDGSGVNFEVHDGCSPARGHPRVCYRVFRRIDEKKLPDCAGFSSPCKARKGAHSRAM
jgi:hypothetical protein